MADAKFFSEFVEIAAVGAGGDLPIVVGGQAVNIWALFYLPRVESELISYAPFVSKDLDLYGSRDVLEALAKKYGGSIKWSPPRFPGVGQLLIELDGKVLNVELLSSVRGLRDSELADAVPLNVLGAELMVLDPICCLKAKVANAVELDQSDRQDVKHIAILKICVREFLKDVLERVEGGGYGERALINLLEDVRSVMESASACKLRDRHGVDLRGVLPLDTLRQCSLAKVKNFCAFRLLLD